MSNNNEKLICTLLYNHQAWDNFGNRVFCCLANYSKFDESQSDIFSNEFQIGQALENFNKRLVEARNEFNNGRFPTECSFCQRKEEIGQTSFRQDNLKEFEETTNRILSRENVDKIEYMDVKLGNICNLKCRMCNPYASSLLKNEFEQIYPGSLRQSENSEFDWYKKNNFFQELSANSKDLKLLHFTGGEPFLNKEMWDYIDALIEMDLAKKIILRFNTNFTIFSEDLFSKLKHFKEVRLYLSIDATEKEFEHIRFPGKWETIVSNFNELNRLAKDNSNVTVILNPAIQILNVTEIKSLALFLSQFENISHLIDLNFVNSPKAFSISSLPQKIKNEIKLLLLSESKDILKLVDNPKELSEQLREVISLLDIENNPRDIKEFLRINQIFDQNRDQTLNDILPAHWIKHILDEVTKA
ncbi:MAG: radical SAM protein [Deltaproteobacteria bacterium]|nr:MAG: radical SAM protein [Deltaproteobacteria bacterium]